MSHLALRVMISSCAWVLFAACGGGGTGGGGGGSADETPGEAETDATDDGSALAEVSCPEATWTEPREHVVTVTASGDLTPDVTCILPGDTVVWSFQGSRYVQSIVPVAEPSADAAAEDACTDYLPFDLDDPNEFTGPALRAVSGLFSRADDEQGLLAPGEIGACQDAGPCTPQPGEDFCSGDKLGGQVTIAAGACYGPGLVCEPEPGEDTCVVPHREPGNYFYTNHHSTWAEPGVVGVLLVFDWRDLEPTRGGYVWDDLDRTVQDAVDHGKTFSIAVKADATRTGIPDWLFEPEPEGMGLAELIFHDAYGRGESCVTAWKHDRHTAHPLDYRFRARYIGVLAATAEHLRERNAHYRALAYVKPSGANLQSPENHLPQGCLQAESGVSDEACACVEANYEAMGLQAAVEHCSESFDGELACCGLCNDAIWETALYYSGPEDVTGATYTGEALIEFYREQTAALAEAFPDKSMTYALIQDGFPKVGLPEGVSGIWQTEQIMIAGAADHGVDYVVQHNALDRKEILGPWVMYRSSLDHPADFAETYDGASFEDYVAATFTEPPYSPADAVADFSAALLSQWEADAVALADDPDHAPWSADDYLQALEDAGVDYQDACLLAGETDPVHPKTMQHYNKYFGGAGACANAQVIAAGANGQITGKQNNSGIQYTDQFLSSLDNGIDYTDALFIEAYETVVQRAVADGADLVLWAEQLHERRRTDWNTWAAEKGWEDRMLDHEPFPTEHRHTFVDDGGEGDRTFHYVHGTGNLCRDNPRVGRIIMTRP